MKRINSFEFVPFLISVFTLSLFVVILHPSIVSASSTNGDTQGHPSAASSSKNHHLAHFPKVTIDGSRIPDSLVETSLIYGFIGHQIIHGKGQFEEYVVKYRDSIIETLIKRELFVREAKRLGLKVSNEEFDQFFKNRLQRYGGEKGVRKLLEEEGATISQYRNLTRHAFIARKYSEKYLQPVITDTDIKDYYDRDFDRFRAVEQRKVDFVRFLFTGAVPESALEDLEKGAKTKDTPQELQRFTKEYKRRHPGKVRTDYLPAITFSSKRQGMIWPVVSALKIGQTGFFKVHNDAHDRNEYYLVFLDTIIPEKVTPLDEIRDKIRTTLFQKRYNKAIKDKVNQLRQDSVIHIVP